MSNRDELRQNLWSNAPRCECCTGAKYHCTAAEPCKHCETFFDYIDAHIAAEVERATIGKGFSIGDKVRNTSGWGVGASTGTPLTVKSVLLEVTWEGAKSTRYLSSGEVEHIALATSHKEPSDAL